MKNDTDNDSDRLTRICKIDWSIRLTVIQWDWWSFVTWLDQSYWQWFSQINDDLYLITLTVIQLYWWWSVKRCDPSLWYLVSSWIAMSRQLHWLLRDESLVQNSFTLVTSGRITRSKLFYTGYLGTNHSFTLVTAGWITRSKHFYTAYLGTNHSF